MAGEGCCCCGVDGCPDVDWDSDVGVILFNVCVAVDFAWPVRSVRLVPPPEDCWRTSEVVEVDIVGFFSLYKGPAPYQEYAVLYMLVELVSSHLAVIN